MIIELPYDPTRNDKQMEFHSATEINRLYGGAMGGGKTAALINEGQQLNFDFPGNFGLLLRKTWPSFKDTVLPQMEKFIPLELLKPGTLGWNHSDKLVTYRNGSRTRYGGLGDRPNDWEKWMSGEYGWIAIDQSEQFTKKEFMMLGTRLRLMIPGIRYAFLLSCNPNIGWIKELFIEKNPKDCIFVPALPTDNQENLPKDYIPRMKSLLTPMLIKSLLEGDWDAVGEPDNVYEYLKVQAAKNRSVAASEPIVIGVDVARSGDDESIIILREGLKISLYSKAQGHDTMRTVGLIWKCCSDRILRKTAEIEKKIFEQEALGSMMGRDEFPLAENMRDSMLKMKCRIDVPLITINVDADGVGGGVVDRLKEQRVDMQGKYLKMVLESATKDEREILQKSGFSIRIKIVEIHGAAKARDKIHFKNQRAEIHWGLKELLGDLDLPNDRELATQLMALKYKINSAGQIQIIPKDEIKKKLGRSPDYAEAVIYSLAVVRSDKEPLAWRV